jgi:hypothetical protein
VLGPLQARLSHVVGVVEADGEELAWLDGRREAHVGQRPPVRARRRDPAQVLDASEQLGQRHVERRVGGGDVDDLIAGDHRRPHAVGGMEGCEPHVAPQSFAKVWAKSGCARRPGGSKLMVGLAERTISPIGIAEVAR